MINKSFFIVIFLYWGYIVTLTEVLKIYQLNSPLKVISKGVLLRSQKAYFRNNFFGLCIFTFFFFLSTEV
jgi:hypothetical protein